MQSKSDVQLASLLDHGDPPAVLDYVRGIFRSMYPVVSFEPVERAYAALADLFAGRFPGYRACNTEYHDLGHTLDCLVAAVRLLDGRLHELPAFPPRLAILLLQAALFHDTGYIQESTDAEGTGAKHTRQHVARSSAFVRRNAAGLGMPAEDAEDIARLIECTGLTADPASLRLEAAEREAGAILGTADLLGQMADRRYLEKLLFLYHEFREAGIPGFDTEFDILRKTLAFYESTRDRLDGPLGRAYRWSRPFFAARHGIDVDLYMEAIDRHMGYLCRIIDDPSTNFRKKLKRMDLELVKDRRGA